MKIIAICFTSILFLPLAQAAVTLTDSIGGAVPDGSVTGLSRSLVLNESGKTITSVEVTLQIGGNPFLGDLYAYLTDGTTLVTLINRPGRDAARLDGYDDAQRLEVIFSDFAAFDFHTYRLAITLDESVALSAPLIGTFQPDGRDTSPLSVLTSDARTSQLSDFNGLDAQRTFTLFVADLSSGATHQVDSWSLNIGIIPEPSTALLTVLGALALLRRNRPACRKFS
jgi:subtilisin-like proprotein convertase family protein